MAENSEPPLKHPLSFKAQKKQPYSEISKNSSIKEASKTLITTEASEEMSEPSKNQLKNKKKKMNSFRLQLGPGRKLREAIEALVDPELNKEGRALIEVDDKIVEITVWNSKELVWACLRLKSSGFINFDFRKPLKGKIINLNQILEYLEMASSDDDNTLTIYHIDCSTELSFYFGRETVVHFGVELLEVDPDFKKFPNISYVCECPLNKEMLMPVLQLVEGTKAKLVSFEISDSEAVFFVERVKLHYSYEWIKKEVVRGIEPGQVHRTMFSWPFCDSLKKASKLGKAVVLCLVTEPKESIMWMVNLQELGSLSYVKTTLMFILNFQLGTHGDSSGPDKDYLTEYIESLDF